HHLRVPGSDRCRRGRRFRDRVARRLPGALPGAPGRQDRRHTMTDALDTIARIADEAAPAWAATPPAIRADALLAAAAALEAAREELVSLARDETGLSDARLGGELTRTIVQARLFADVVRRGA